LNIHVGEIDSSLFGSEERVNSLEGDLEGTSTSRERSGKSLAKCSEGKTPLQEVHSRQKRVGKSMNRQGRASTLKKE
jgi:hypothetical protein